MHEYETLPLIKEWQVRSLREVDLATPEAAQSYASKAKATLQNEDSTLDRLLERMVGYTAPTMSGIHGEDLRSLPRVLYGVLASVAEPKEGDRRYTESGLPRLSLPRRNWALRHFFGDGEQDVSHSATSQRMHDHLMGAGERMHEHNHPLYEWLVAHQGLYVGETGKVDALCGALFVYGMLGLQADDIAYGLFRERTRAKEENPSWLAASREHQKSEDRLIDRIISGSIDEQLARPARSRRIDKGAGGRPGAAFRIVQNAADDVADPKIADLLGAFNAAIVREDFEEAARLKRDLNDHGVHLQWGQ